MPARPSSSATSSPTRNARARTFGLDERARDALLGGGEDRHQQGHARQLVRRLLRPLHGRRLGRQRDGAPMHDVSGVSGAAPVWREVIELLHAGEPSTAPRAAGGRRRTTVAFETRGSRIARSCSSPAPSSASLRATAEVAGEQRSASQRRATAASSRSTPTSRRRPAHQLRGRARRLDARRQAPRPGARAALAALAGAAYLDAAAPPARPAIGALRGARRRREGQAGRPRGVTAGAWRG